MNEKCPCCGAEISDFEESGFWECEECPFMCALEDLPRIAAAMELARAEANLNQARECFDESSALRSVRSAHERVLEVFGGE